MSDSAHSRTEGLLLEDSPFDCQEAMLFRMRAHSEALRILSSPERYGFLTASGYEGGNTGSNVGAADTGRRKLRTIASVNTGKAMIGKVNE